MTTNQVIKWLDNAHRVCAKAEKVVLKVYLLGALIRKRQPWTVLSYAAGAASAW